MTTDGNIEYAFSRVEAHYGRRMGESEWRRLEASRDLAHYLDAARAGPLADWVSSIDLTHDSHAIERSLRGEWRRYVDSAAAWHPCEWQQWLGWLGWLPTLSLLAQLARAEPAPTWMMADPLCGPIAPGNLADRIAALHGTALIAFEPAIAGRVAIGALWAARWQSLRPPTDAHTGQLLDALQRAIHRYAQQLTRENGSATAPRQELTGRLAKLFRAGAGTVVATVCHLALLTFDLERLRGGMVNRCAFPPRAVEAA